MTAETYVGTAEDGIHQAAVTIVRFGGRVLTLGSEDDAGSVDSVQPFPADDDLDDYIRWLTGELGFRRAETPWNVYAVDIACYRGRWTYLASHDPAMPLEDWIREQVTLCAGSLDQPWSVRVYQPDADGDPAGAPIAEVGGGR